MSTAWDNARRHARALETALEAKLSSYSKLAATISRGPAGAGSSSRDVPSHEDEGVGGYKLVEEEVEELLGKVGLSIWAGNGVPAHRSA
jgi:Golgi SNAP receptor complex protein 1